MTKYNFKIEIEETGNQKNPFRDTSILEGKNVACKEIEKILDIVHKEWVRRVDGENDKDNLYR